MPRRGQPKASLVPFTPFNGVLRVESGRPTLLHEACGAGAWVDIHNHGPDTIWVRSIHPPPAPERMALKLDPGGITGGWCEPHSELVATIREPTWVRPAGEIIRTTPKLARVSVRRFRTGHRAPVGRKN